MTDDKTKQEAEERQEEVVDPLPESSGVKEANEEDPKAKDVDETIQKTTEVKATTNEANLGQPVADASGDQTDDPNAPNVNLDGRQSDEVTDEANEQGKSAEQKTKEKYA
jgi:hypothetical protein